MKYALILLSITLLSCKKDKVLDSLKPGTIEGETFNSTVLIDGHDYDGTIIKDCVFEKIDGDGLQIRDVDNLCIENCIFRDISEDAIRFRNSGSSNGVKIQNNEIYDIEENGILAPEDHINTLIKGNLIHNVATNNSSSQFGAPHHGIYFQGFNVTITENTIYDVRNDQGNCVSIRTYGEISRNKLYNSTDHGISYFSDHPGNGEKLLIENNIIYDNGKRGINLASNGNTSNHIGSAVIRFNTVLSNSEAPIGTNDNLSGVSVDIFGNILVRTDGDTPFIYSSLAYTESNNITSAGDVGFVNFASRDLHIISTSGAVSGIVGTVEYPVVDFDGDVRNGVDLDIGADEL